MPRRRRYFESGGLYEICIRAKKGLPFPCRRIITTLIKSALARTQRNNKVLLNHFLWMGNHAHILMVVKDATEATKFYGELQKRITDYLKRLYGSKHLNLWEERISCIHILDLDSAIKTISYFYTNPSKADLEDNIELYPGYSSWNAFTNIKDSFTARATEIVPWIRNPAVPEASRSNISFQEDDELTNTVIKSAKKKHKLSIFPNLWMKCFGVEAHEIKEVNQRIKNKIVELEAEYRAIRLKNNKKVIGASRLKSQPLMVDYEPKRKDRRIFVKTSINQLRLAYIKKIKTLCEVCDDYYQRWKRCDFSFKWPAGIFPPPLPMVASALA